MKSALLIPAVVAVLLAASPAMACRRPAAASPPGPDDRVAFIATIDSRGTDVLEQHAEVSALLRVQQRITGRTHDLVTIQARVDRPITGEIVISSCGAARPDLSETLAAAPLGSEVVVLGRQTGGEAVRIEDLAPLNSPRGLELLIAVERP